MKEVSYTSPAGGKNTSGNTPKHAREKATLVRTYRADVQNLITTKKITRTHVAIAEEERRRAIGESAVWEQPKPSSMIPAVIAGIFLLVGVSVLFYDLVGKSIPVFVSGWKETHPFVIPGEKEEYIGLSQFTKDELVRAVRTLARGEKLSQGEHIRIAYRARTGTTTLAYPVQNFFKTIEATPPNTFLRSIKSAYEGGIISAGEKKGYLVFTTTYYENTVVGLLEWETRMPFDLYPIIDPLRSELGLLPEGTWRTQTWEQHDLRVFETTDRRIQLTYGWIDKKILIITGTLQAWSELSRLLTAKTPEAR